MVHKRIGLTMLYMIVLFLILLAFPEKWGSEELLSTFSSAPKTSQTNYKISLVTVWKVKNIRDNKPQQETNTPSNSGWKTTATTSTQISTTKKRSISCADINVCQKIHFSDTYTSAQKIKYYNALLQTLSSLNTILPQSPNLASTIYSIGLSPEDTNNERRWRGGSKTILIQTKNITTLQEFREVLTHELAHIIDLGMLIWDSQTKNEDFTISENTYFGLNDPSLSFYQISWKNSTTRHASASYLDFVWGYAMSSPYEDFAEAFTMYIRHNDIFKQWTEWSSILQKKYEYMKNLTQGQNLSKDGTGIQNGISRRPWDVTRISLE